MDSHPTWPRCVGRTCSQETPAAVSFWSLHVGGVSSQKSVQKEIYDGSTFSAPPPSFSGPTLVFSGCLTVLTAVGCQHAGCRHILLRASYRDSLSSVLPRFLHGVESIHPIVSTATRWDPSDRSGERSDRSGERSRGAITRIDDFFRPSRPRCGRVREGSRSTAVSSRWGVDTSDRFYRDAIGPLWSLGGAITRSDHEDRSLLQAFAT